LFAKRSKNAFGCLKVSSVILKIDDEHGSLMTIEVVCHRKKMINYFRP
jgi:hypothetical protein